MRRFTYSFLLSLLLILGGGLEISAQVFIPRTSTSGVTYTYYIKSAGENPNYYVSAANMENGGAVTLTSGDMSDAQAFKLVAGEEGMFGTYVYICTPDESYVVDWWGDDFPAYFDAGGQVYGCGAWFWTISYGSEPETMNGCEPYFRISYSTEEEYEELGLNWFVSDGNEYCGLGSSAEKNSIWNFIPADLSTMKKTAEDIKATLNPYAGFAYSESFSSSNVISDLKSQISEIESLSEYSLESANKLLAAYSTFLTYGDRFVKDDSFTTGYYRITNKATDRYRYLFNDDFYDSNDYLCTLLSKEPVETNNGYWYVEVDGNTLNIKNGQGNGITEDRDLMIYSALNIYEDEIVDGYYSFEEALSSSKGYGHFVGSYYSLTTSESAESNSSAENRWAFEKIDETTVYKVDVTGLEDNFGLYVTYTHDGTTEYAYSGGFFVSADVPDVSKMTIPDQNGYVSATFTVEGQTIKVEYKKKDINPKIRN